MREIEVKILGIDPVKIFKKLEKLGAKKILDSLLRVRFFDYANFRIRKSGGVLRLREEGCNTFLVAKGKKVVKNGLKIADEIEISVDDFDGVSRFLTMLGFVMTVNQEKKRRSYEYHGAIFDIDEYPGGVTYLEIEAGTVSKVEAAIRLLGLERFERSSETATEFFSRKYPQMNFSNLRFL